MDTLTENSIFIIEGTKVQLQPKDYDKDGKTGEVETIKEDFSNIYPASETKEALAKLNEDMIEADGRFSSIDFNSRVKMGLIPDIVRYDFCCRMGLLPIECSDLTRKLLRLYVSEEGKGRKEGVSLFLGKREYDKSKLTFKEGMKNLFKGGKRQNEPT